MKAFSPADWYRPVEGSDPVLQGDQLFQILLRRIIPSQQAPGSYDIGVERANAIVATQSCDIEQRKVAVIEVIPFYPLATWLFYQPAQANQLESIRRGFVPSVYLLPAWPDAPIQQARETRVVVLDEKRTVSWADLEDAVAGQRLGLHHPYIEHFGQAIARFYMRIGLPEDIPPIGLKDILDEPGKKDNRVELPAGQFSLADLPVPTKPLHSIVQKMQVTGGPDVFYRAQLEQDKNFSGFGSSQETAMESLLRLVARKRHEMMSKSAPQGETHWILSTFPQPTKKT